MSLTKTIDSFFIWWGGVVIRFARFFGIGQKQAVYSGILVATQILLIAKASLDDIGFRGGLIILGFTASLAIAFYMLRELEYYSTSEVLPGGFCWQPWLRLTFLLVDLVGAGKLALVGCHPLLVLGSVFLPPATIHFYLILNYNETPKATLREVLTGSRVLTH